MGVIATYDYEGDTNYYNLKMLLLLQYVVMKDDEDLADIMERKLEEAIENYMWSDERSKKSKWTWTYKRKAKEKRI